MNPSASMSCGATCRAVVFDVDGTLVEHAGSLVIWQLLNRRFRVDPTVDKDRFDQFVKGELAYAEWVRLDIEGWRDAGATRALISRLISEELALVPDARRVVHELAARGFVTAVVSGTLDIVLDQLFPDHPFSYVFTNEIEFDVAGKICGWTATPYDMDGKARAIRHLSGKLNIAPGEFAFIGDNINDCEAMRFVGLPIAYDPKHQSVRDVARYVLPRGKLASVLDILGEPKRGPGCEEIASAGGDAGI